MKRRYITVIVFVIVLLQMEIYASSVVKLIKKQNSDSNTTLLVIGGIHGNEPGGYFATSILATHYKILSKNLWIVPNLNQASIQANKRGIHGDMNRKFAIMKKNDKDKEIVDEIKKIILSKQVSLILNLHDGHGFYRKKNEGSIFNPTAWGQTCVIDQCRLNQKQPFGDLNHIASTVKNSINKKLIKTHHSFNVRNTNTKFDDEAMQLSLTYFAVTNNKPAFAIESSKNLSTLSEKVFYQLLAIEEFMKIMDISFKRDFDLNEVELEKILKNYGTLMINHNILLNLCDIKKSLSYIPLKSIGNVFEFSHPLGSIKYFRGTYEVYIGNKKLTVLRPEHFEMAEDCMDDIDVVVDKQQKTIKKASYFSVDDDFKILKSKTFRVNVIGFRCDGCIDESGIDINSKRLNKRFSIDRYGKDFRVEFYKKDKFCSMSIVHIR
jgi:hypothetical protein